MDNETKIQKIITPNKYFSDLQIKKIFESEYNRQAIDFLVESNTTCDIELIGQDFSNWNKKSKVNTLTPEQFNEYERKAWQLIDSLGYKNATRGSITTNFGHNEDEMTFIQLLPKQKQLVMR